MLCVTDQLKVSQNNPFILLMIQESEVWKRAWLAGWLSSDSSSLESPEMAQAGRPTSAWLSQSMCLMSWPPWIPLSFPPGISFVSPCHLDLLLHVIASGVVCSK